MKILIYTDTLSERLRYLIEVVFNEITPYTFEITNNFDSFLHSNDLKINYSLNNAPNCLQIIPFELLFSDEIKPYKLNFFEPENIVAFEENLQEKNQYIYSHDFFAVVFFIISRYEEYLDFMPDYHGRYTAKKSSLYAHGLHKKPYIDIQINRFFSTLKIIYPAFEPKPLEKIERTLTVDIDRIYKYKGKSSLHLFSKCVKNFVFFNKNELKCIYNYVIKKQPDPYDAYNFIHNFTSQHKTKLHVFYLLSNKGKFDKNIIDFNLLKQIYSLFKTESRQGIHPSYHSNFQKDLLKNEIKLFEKFFNIFPIESRQHYLKLTFPDTYNNLIANKIKQDFSMGWSDSIGFRAGTSHTFTWFNLSINKTSILKITPFCAMDVTLKNYLKLNTKEAIIELREVLKTIEDNGGQFVSLWHNESLGTDYEWAGWREVMEEIYN